MAREFIPKVKKYKGVIGAVVMGICLIGTGLFLLTQGILLTPQQLFEKGQVVDANIVNEIVAIEVSDIIDTGAQSEDGKRHFYLTWSETEQKTRIIDADIDDNEIQELVKNYESLIKNPAYLKVRVYKQSEIASNYPALVHEVNKYYNVAVSDSVQLSVADARNKLFVDKLMIIGIISIGIISLGVGVFRLRQNHHYYNELFDVYPELERDYTLISKGDYFDPKLQVAVYKQHLIFMFGAIKCVKLVDIERIQTYIIRSYGVEAHFFATIFKTDGKKLQAPVRKAGKETETRLQSLYEFVYANKSK